VDSHDALLMGAVGAAVIDSLRLDPMADDFAATVGAAWGERVDCALEAVEDMRPAKHYHLK